MDLKKNYNRIKEIHRLIDNNEQIINLIEKGKIEIDFVGSSVKIKFTALDFNKNLLYNIGNKTE